MWDVEEKVIPVINMLGCVYLSNTTNGGRLYV